MIKVKNPHHRKSCMEMKSTKIRYLFMTISNNEILMIMIRPMYYVYNFSIKTLQCSHKHLLVLKAVIMMSDAAYS